MGYKPEIGFWGQWDGYAEQLMMYILGVSSPTHPVDKSMYYEFDRKTKDYKDIKDISDIKSTPVGDKYVIVLTIYVDGNMKTFDSHKLADNLEKDVNKLEKVYRTIVHVEPV